MHISHNKQPYLIIVTIIFGAITLIIGIPQIKFSVITSYIDSVPSPLTSQSILILPTTPGRVRVLIPQLDTEIMLFFTSESTSPSSSQCLFPILLTYYQYFRQKKIKRKISSIIVLSAVKMKIQ